MNRVFRLPITTGIVILVWALYVGQLILPSNAPGMEYVTFRGALFLSSLTVFLYHLFGPMGEGKIKNGIGPPLSFAGMMVGLLWIILAWIF